MWCITPNSKGHLCANNSCTNYAVYKECPIDCTAGEGCNTWIHNKEWKKVQITTTVEKGKGLVAIEFIQKDDTVTEHVGVAHPTDLLTSLMNDLSGMAHQYLMELSLIPDLNGGLVRFINHCCEPNCIVQCWKVRLYQYFQLPHILL